eukprot:4462233-Pleurochrysis_carterae.AAC.1
MNDAIETERESKTWKRKGEKKSKERRENRNDRERGIHSPRWTDRESGRFQAGEGAHAWSGSARAKGCAETREREDRPSVLVKDSFQEEEKQRERASEQASSSAHALATLVHAHKDRKDVSNPTETDRKGCSHSQRPIQLVGG